MYVTYFIVDICLLVIFENQAHSISKVSFYPVKQLFLGRSFNVICALFPFYSIFFLTALRLYHSSLLCFRCPVFKCFVLQFGGSECNLNNMHQIQFSKILFLHLCRVLISYFSWDIVIFHIGKICICWGHSDSTVIRMVVLCPAEPGSISVSQMFP